MRLILSLLVLCILAACEETKLPSNGKKAITPFKYINYNGYDFSECHIGSEWQRNFFYKILIAKDGKYYVTRDAYDCEMGMCRHSTVLTRRITTDRGKTYEDFDYVDDFEVKGVDEPYRYIYITINLYDLCLKVYKMLEVMLNPHKKKPEFEFNVFWFRGRKHLSSNLVLVTGEYGHILKKKDYDKWMLAHPKTEILKY